MVGFRESIISIVLVGLFIFAFISFGGQIALDNNANNTVLSNPAVNQSFIDIQSQLQEVQIDTEGQKKAWFEDVPIVGDINLIWKSLTGIIRVFFDVIVNMYNLIINLISETIGISSVVLNTIAALLSISMLLLLWRLIRSGS